MLLFLIVLALIVLAFQQLRYERPSWMMRQQKVTHKPRKVERFNPALTASGFRNLPCGVKHDLSIRHYAKHPRFHI